MRIILSGAIFAILLLPVCGNAQEQETSRAVAGGGISVPGWTGKIDASRENTGLTLNDAKFTKEGDTFHVQTGPAVTYWNASDTANGNYTVKATFSEPKFMNLNTHPHPYGIVIAGNDMGAPNMSYLYCAAYGDGRFIVRGFGPDAFQVHSNQYLAFDVCPQFHRDSQTIVGNATTVRASAAMSPTRRALTC